MGAGVHGHMKAVVRPVVVEPGEEPDHVTTQDPVMVERTALDLMLQAEHVTQIPVQVICIVYNTQPCTGDMYCM